MEIHNIIRNKKMLILSNNELLLLQLELEEKQLNYDDFLNASVKLPKEHLESYICDMNILKEKIKQKELSIVSQKLYIKQAIDNSDSSLAITRKAFKDMI